MDVTRAREPVVASSHSRKLHRELDCRRALRQELHDKKESSLLVDPRAQHAELVPLGIGKDDPARIA